MKRPCFACSLDQDPPPHPSGAYIAGVVEQMFAPDELLEQLCPLHAAVLGDFVHIRKTVAAALGENDNADN